MQILFIFLGFCSLNQLKINKQYRFFKVLFISKTNFIKTMIKLLILYNDVIIDDIHLVKKWQIH